MPNIKEFKGFGTKIHLDGMRFAIWAPDKETITEVLKRKFDDPDCQPELIVPANLVNPDYKEEDLQIDNPNGHLLFSDRLKLSEAVEEWYKKNPEAERCPFNTITALNSMRLIKKGGAR